MCRDEVTHVGKGHVYRCVGPMDRGPVTLHQVICRDAAADEEGDQPEVAVAALHPPGGLPRAVPQA